MKLSEYAADLLVMVQLYGDHDIVEGHHDSNSFNRTVPAPRFRRVAVAEGLGYECTMAQLQVKIPAPYKLTGEQVYVI